MTRPENRRCKTCHELQPIDQFRTKSCAISRQCRACELAKQRESWAEKRPAAPTIHKVPPGYCPLCCERLDLHVRCDGCTIYVGPGHCESEFVNGRYCSSCVPVGRVLRKAA